jgi:hypothetical protein
MATVRHVAQCHLGSSTQLEAEMIAPDSPLRRIPAALDRRQAMFFDGIRYSVEMVDLAYARLCDSLCQIAGQFAEGNTQPGLPATFAAPFIDAWSIVDSVHRLRELLEQTPNLKRSKSPSYELFRRKTALVTELRNTIQHLRNELTTFAERDWPAYGVIDWLSIVDAQEGIVKACVMVSGKVRSGSFPVRNPAGLAIQGPVDHVTLQCKEERLGLSDLVRAIEPIVRGLENSLRSQVADEPTDTSDLCVCMTVKLDLEQPPATENS